MILQVPVELIAKIVGERKGAFAEHGKGVRKGVVSVTVGVQCEASFLIAGP
jgi:hypothetical protein